MALGSSRHTAPWDDQLGSKGALNFASCFFPPAPLLSLRQGRMEEMNATISPKTGTKANAAAPEEAGLDPASGSDASDGGDLGGTSIG